MFDDGRGSDLVINIVVGINFVSNLVFNKETWIFNFTNVVITVPAEQKAVSTDGISCLFCQVRDLQRVLIGAGRVGQNLL